MRRASSSSRARRWLALLLLAVASAASPARAVAEASKTSPDPEQSATPLRSSSSPTPANVSVLLRDTPLIPVELLYGQPVAADPQISPDGLWLSFLAPSPPNNTLNVFVAPLRNSSSPSEPSQELPPKAFQLTRETAYDIDPGQYQWSPDSRFVLYLFDRDPRVGDQYRLWRKDITKPEEEAVDLLPEFSTARRSSGSGGAAASAPSNRTLPPGLMGDKLHIGQFFLSEKVPDLALITIDERSPGIFDVYRLDLATGELKLDTLNPGDVASWVPDKFLRVRGARALLPAGGGVFRTRSVRSPYIDLKKQQDELVARKKKNGGSNKAAASSPPLSEEEERIASAKPYPWVRDDAKETTDWKEVARWNSSDVFIPVSAAGHAFAFANEGKSVLVLTSANASAVRLVQLSASTGKLEKVLAEGDKGKNEDVVATAFDAVTGDLAAFATERLRRKWRTTAKGWDPDAELVHKALNGSDEFSVASKASDNSRVILRFVSDTAPPTYYLLDRRDKRNRTVTKQITELPGLDNYTLAPQKGFEVRARDGLLLPSYVTLPPAWIAANESASSSKNSSTPRPGPLPLVVVVRAQPWARDSFGFTPAVQAIANLGAAVLQVNFRGSSGFGRAFVARAAGEWGLRMTEDLVDAVDWAVKEGIADPKRVAIFGFSYGGYAALDALTTHPEVFSCAASLSGAARFDSARSLNPPGWVPPPAAPGSEAAARFEERGYEISPLSHVDNLRGTSNSSSNSNSSSPQWLLQAIGGRDDGKLQAAARELAKEAAKRGVVSELLVYPKEGHALRLDESRVDFGSRLTRFLGRCLGIADEGREPAPVEVEDADVVVEVEAPALAEEFSSSSSSPSARPRLIKLEDRAPALNTTDRLEEAGVAAKSGSSGSSSGGR